MEIKTRNVNDMLSEALWKFRVSADVEETRNGKAMVMREPTILTYRRPQERVLFAPRRDANPIFHLMESIWILAGRDDVDFPSLFNKNIKNYSDDGRRFNAAYGERMRKAFGHDQLVQAVGVLKAQPGTRRAVIQLWHTGDLTKDTLDKACNLLILPEIKNGKLNITVMNRSNDLWWGACGANAVQFSMIQEFLAGALGVEIGEYRQVTNNLHLYLDIYDGEAHMNNPWGVEGHNLYQTEGLEPYPLFSGLDGTRLWKNFLEECELFCEDPFTEREYTFDFFNDVAYPMAMVAWSRKVGDSGSAYASRVKAEDWREAVTQWVARRERAREVAA